MKGGKHLKMRRNQRNRGKVDINEISDKCSVGFTRTEYLIDQHEKIQSFVQKIISGLTYEDDMALYKKGILDSPLDI